MISSIASKVVKKLIDNSAIDDAEQELYVYGFFVLISHTLYFILTIIFGILLGIVLESVIFYVAFQFIRRFAGGIHASNELKCGIVTTSSIFLCLLCIKLCEANHVQTPVLILTTFAAVSIFILCPLDTPEKPLSEKELKYFRKITWIILSVIFLVVIISYFVHLKWLQIFFAPCCLSLILESLLLIAGKAKKLTLNKSE